MGTGALNTTQHRFVENCGASEIGCIETGVHIRTVRVFLSRIINVVQIAFCHSHEIRAGANSVWPIIELSGSLLQVESARLNFNTRLIAEASSIRFVRGPVMHLLEKALRCAKAELIFVVHDRLSRAGLLGRRGYNRRHRP